MSMAGPTSTNAPIPIEFRLSLGRHQTSLCARLWLRYRDFFTDLQAKDNRSSGDPYMLVTLFQIRQNAD